MSGTKLVRPLLAALLTSACLAGAETQSPPPASGRKLAIRPVDKAKWGCEVEDVQAVLYSAANQFWRYFPERSLPPIEVSPKGGPITLYQRGPSGEIRVKLNSGDGLWAQIAYQFAHEFCHILCGNEEYEHCSKWFEESLCEAASLFALRRMAEAWRSNPPYQNWKSYAPSLREYADERMQKATLPAGTTLAKWYEENRAALAKEPCDRPRNNIVAGVLLKHFEAAPERWEALGFLNKEKLAKDHAFKDYLQAWQRHCPEKHKGLVTEIARELGLELSSNH